PLGRQPRLEPTVLFGGSNGGGSNYGYFGYLGVGFRMPGLGESISIDLQAGYRRFNVLTATLFGTQNSNVTAYPIELAGRLRLADYRRYVFYFRLGAGLVPFSHVTTSTFGTALFSGSALTFDAFAALEFASRLGRIEVYV